MPSGAEITSEARAQADRSLGGGPGRSTRIRVENRAAPASYATRGGRKRRPLLWTPNADALTGTHLAGAGGERGGGADGSGSMDRSRRRADRRRRRRRQRWSPPCKRAGSTASGWSSARRLAAPRPAHGVLGGGDLVQMLFEGPAAREARGRSADRAARRGRCSGNGGARPCHRAGTVGQQDASLRRLLRHPHRRPAGGDGRRADEAAGLAELSGVSAWPEFRGQGLAKVLRPPGGARVPRTRRPAVPALLRRQLPGRSRCTRSSASACGRD